MSVKVIWRPTFGLEHHGPREIVDEVEQTQNTGPRVFFLVLLCIRGYVKLSPYIYIYIYIISTHKVT